MSNENVKMGLDPQPDNKGFIEVRPLIPISAAVNTVNALFKGSPYKITSGTVQAAVAGNAELIAGSIVKLYNSNKKEVLNLPASTAGYADVTYQPGQRYQITVESTTFADNGSNNGAMYNITDEGGTANADGFSGSGNSTIQITGAAAASTRQIIASFKVRKDGNVGGVAGTLVECVINPVNHQAW